MGLNTLHGGDYGLAFATGGLSLVPSLFGGGGGGGGNKNSPDAIRAGLARDDYMDWLTTFRMGVEEPLIDSYQNQSLRNAAVSDAVSTTQNSLATANGSFRRNMDSLGVQLTPEQEAVRQRQSNLNNSLSVVNAINQTGRRMDERDEMLATGMRGQSGAAQMARGG